MMTARYSAILVAVLFGCGAAGNDGGTAAVGDEQDIVALSSAEASACQEGTVGPDANGDTVVHCTKPFPSAPLVRLPADALGATSATFYAGVTLPTDFSNQFVLWTRDGKRYTPIDDKGAPIAFNDAKKLPHALHAPTNRITFTLYQFTGKLGASVTSPYGDATAITLSAARPVVELDGCAMDSRLLGTWDGSVSERLEMPQGSGPFVKSFDESKRVPIHITLATISKRPALTEYIGGKTLADASTFLTEGTIDNFDHDVTADGKTYPSLQAMGNKNPFLGAKDGKIQLYRLGNMHGQQNDGHWVLTYPAGSQSLTGNGMSYTLTAYTAPSFLFAEGASADPLLHAEIKPHLPYVSNGHSVLLTPASIGAQTGQCPK